MLATYLQQENKATYYEVSDARVQLVYLSRSCRYTVRMHSTEALYRGRRLTGSGWGWGVGGGGLIRSNPIVASGPSTA